MLVLLDWSLISFVKSKIAIMLGILILYKYFFLRWLSKRGNNFIADWVNEERILTYTE
jgi:hypothetical protein